jgi:hypothetical protein
VVRSNRRHPPPREDRAQLSKKPVAASRRRDRSRAELFHPSFVIEGFAGLSASCFAALSATSNSGITANLATALKPQSNTLESGAPRQLVTLIPNHDGAGARRVLRYLRGGTTVSTRSVRRLISAPQARVGRIRAWGSY